jgi:hypothetical protein
LDRSDHFDLERDVKRQLSHPDSGASVPANALAKDVDEKI